MALLPSQQLSYYEADKVSLPAITPALLFCVPALLWLGFSCLFLFRFIDIDKDGGGFFLILLPVPFCGFRAFAKYWRASRTWYVVVCLAINAVGIALTATPLVLLWAWALLALLAK
jgi:hypothetical protein